LDDIFTKEIKYAEEKQYWWFCFSFGKTKNNYKDILQDASPIMLKYYKNIFDDA
jgi:hypothetical protein